MAPELQAPGGGLARLRTAVRSLIAAGKPNLAEKGLSRLLLLFAEEQRESEEFAELDPEVSMLFGALVHAFAKVEKVSGAELWVRKMIDRGIEVDAGTFGVLIRAFTRPDGSVNNRAKAEMWLEQMRECKVAPTAVIYTNVIHACARAGDLARAEKLFEEMQADPMNPLKPDQVTWNTMVNACARSNKLSEAEGYLRRMLEAGLPGNVLTFTTLLTACARKGALRKAEHWLGHMERVAGLKPDLITYNNMISACCAAGDAPRAEHYLNRMKADGFVPDKVCNRLMARVRTREAAQTACGAEQKDRH